MLPSLHLSLSARLHGRHVALLSRVMLLVLHLSLVVPWLQDRRVLLLNRGTLLSLHLPFGAGFTARRVFLLRRRRPGLIRLFFVLVAILILICCAGDQCDR